MRQAVNGKWLAQPPSGTQRYASQVMEAVSRTPAARRILLVLPGDAEAPDWAAAFPTVRSRWRGVLFEQLALPWLTRGMYLYSMAGPAPLLKRRQTALMHDAMPFRYPQTFRRAFVLWYTLLYGVLSRTADRLLTVSTFSRGELATTLRVPEARFGLAPCGSDHLDAVAPGPSPTTYPPGTFALIVGNLAPHKNVEAAATALGAAGVPVVVVGVGQQVFRQAAFGGGENIEVLGRIDDAQLQRLYADAGVLVAPSRYEGFGIPVVEAGRQGCPAVFALGSALTEVAGDGGLGFPAGDMAECVRLVKQVLTDADLRRRLGEAARANADRFTWDRTAQVIFGDIADRRVRVLHVTETFSAGTGTAIIGFSRAMKDQGVDSFLLAQDRGSGLLDEVVGDSPFVDARLVEPGLLTLWRAIPGAVRDFRPDIVHLHSSKAGAIGRVTPPLPGGPQIVYSPHCFAFERRDIPALFRFAYGAVEWLLARRTAAFVCVSPHEADLARRLRRAAMTRDVMNTFALQLDAATAPSADGDGLSIVTVGRVAPQKDPDLFLEILTQLRARTDVTATWVGDGTVDGRAQVEGAGVAMTGWIPLAEVAGVVSRHTVYLHTAGWEASVPIAVLDAMSAGVPTVTKRNAAYRGLLPDDWQFDDAAEAVTMILALATPQARAQRVEEQFALLDSLRARGPEHVLADAYRDLLGAAQRTTSPVTES